MSSPWDPEALCDLGWHSVPRSWGAGGCVSALGSLGAHLHDRSISCPLPASACTHVGTSTGGCGPGLWLRPSPLEPLDAGGWRVVWDGSWELGMWCKLWAEWGVEGVPVALGHVRAMTWSGPVAVPELWTHARCTRVCVLAGIYTGGRTVPH